MIRVTVDINRQIIFESEARRIDPVNTEIKPSKICTYIVDEDEKKIIKHRYGNGAKKLILKLLEGWDEKRK